MCGIIAVLRRVSRRQPPAKGHLLTLLAEAESALVSKPTAGHLDDGTKALVQIDHELGSVSGLWVLLQDEATSPQKP